MGANHQPLQRFWPFTRDSLHIGSHHKQAAPRFVLEAPGWSHLHVVLQWPAKENNGDCSCAMPRENESVLRTIPFTAEKRLLRSSGPEPPIGIHGCLLFDTTNFENLDTTPTLAKKVEWLPIHLDSYDSSRARFWHLSHEGQLSGHGHICLLWPETLSRLTQAVSNENPMKVQ